MYTCIVREHSDSPTASSYWSQKYPPAKDRPVFLLVYVGITQLKPGETLDLHQQNIWYNLIFSC